MARSIILDAAERIACPKCNHGFPLSEGISRQTIERYAEDFEKAFICHKTACRATLQPQA